MPLNAGEVETVLSARDTMSPAFISAAERVVDLRAKIVDLGNQLLALNQSTTATRSEIQQVTTAAATMGSQLAVAEAQFTSLKEAQDRLTIASERRAAAEVAAVERQLEAQAARIAGTIATEREMSAFERAATAQGTLTNATLGNTVAEKEAAAATTLRTKALLEAAEASRVAANVSGGAAAAAGFTPVAGSPISNIPITAIDDAEQRLISLTARVAVANATIAAGVRGTIGNARAAVAEFTPQLELAEVRLRALTSAENVAAIQESTLNAVRGQTLPAIQAVTGATQASTVAQTAQTAAAVTTANRLLGQSAAAGSAAAATGNLTTISANATTAINNLGAAAGGGGTTGINSVAAAAGGGGNNLNQMDRMATRLIERLLILGAVRLTFNFIKDLYEGSAELVRISEQTDISIGKLETIKNVGLENGVPFSKVTAAIDTLDKKLAEAKGSTSQALLDIGLSFKQVFDLNPDERFDLIVAAISALPNQLQRNKAEAELFGSEGIDPLIKKLAELHGQLSTDIIPPEQIRVLADADKGFHEFTQTLKVWSAQLFTSGIDAVQFMASPFFKWLSTDYLVPKRNPDGTLNLNHLVPNENTSPLSANPVFSSTNPLQYIPGMSMFGSMFMPPGAEDAMRSAQEAANRSMPSPPKPKPVTPIMDNELLDQLYNESTQSKPLTPSQASKLAKLKSIDELTLDHAVKMRDDDTGETVTPTQFKNYEKSLRDAKTFARDSAQIGRDMANEEFNNQKSEIEATEQGFRARYDILQAEHEAKVKIIDTEKKSQAVKNADYKAEDARFNAAMTGEAEKEGEALAQIKARSDAAIAEAATKDGTKTLADQIALLNQQEVNDKAAAARKFGDTQLGLQAQDAITHEYEAKRLSAQEAADKKFTTQRDKLQRDIDAIDEAAVTKGLAYTLAKINKEEDAEVAAAINSGFTAEQKQILITEAQEKGIKARRQARNTAYQIEDRELATITAQTLDNQINLYMSGAEKEIAIAQVAHDKKIEILKDQNRWTEDLQAAEDKNLDSRIALIKSKYDPLWQAWQHLNDDMRNEWAGTWDKALQGTGSFVDALDEPFKEMSHSFTKMLSGMVADWEMELLGPMIGSFHNTLSRMFGMPTHSGPGGYSTGFGGAGSFGASGGGGSSITNFGGGGNNLNWNTYGDKWWYDEMGRPVGDTSTKPSTGAVVASGIASGALQGFGADTSHGFNHAMISGLGGDSAQGSAQTVAMGIATFGISVGVQAAVAALKYAFRDRTVEDVARDAGENFGQVWSEALTEKIIAASKGQGSNGAIIGETAGELAFLPDIIKEHPINLENLDMYEGKLRDIYVMIAERHFTIAQGAQLINSVFPEMAKVATDSYGMISDKLREIISLNEDFTTHSQAITDFLKGQGSSAATSFGGIVDYEDRGKVYDDIKARIDKALALANPTNDTDLAAQDKWEVARGKVDDEKKKYDKMVTDGKSTPAELAAQWAKYELALAAAAKLSPDLTKALEDQAAAAKDAKDKLEDLGTLMIIDFAAAVGSGTPMNKVLKDMHDSINRLAKDYDDLGLTADNPAIKELLAMDKVYSANPKALDAIGALASGDASLGNMGLLNQERFDAEQRTAVHLQQDLYNTGISQGLTTDDALRVSLLPMQSWLHQAQRDAEKNHVALSDDTKAQIESSKKLGIWSDNFGTDAERLRDKIDDLINELKGLPAAIHDAIVPPIPAPPTKGGGNPQPEPPGTPTPEPDPRTQPGGPTVPTTDAVGRRLTLSDQALSGGWWSGRLPPQYPAPQTIPTGSVTLNIGGIHLTSDDTKDPERVADVLNWVLVHDTRGVTTNIRQLARRAVI